MTRLITIDLDDPAVMEALAAQQHDIWSHWMRYQFSCCHDEYDLVLLPQGDPTGGRIIPADKAERWQRQMNTPYQDLSEQERVSDREQAAKIMAVLAQQAQSAEVRSMTRADKLANHYDAGAGGLPRLQRKARKNTPPPAKPIPGPGRLVTK